METRLKIRLGLWSGLGVAVLALLWLGVVPGGAITYSYDFDQPNYFIRKLTPEERVLPPAGGQQVVVGDPAYFAVRTPRAFARAKLTLKYQNPDNVPVIEAGVLSDKKVWRYQTRPLLNRHLDELAKNWTTTGSGPAKLYQQEKRYRSVEDFLNGLPLRQSIAVYNYNLEAPFRLAGYRPTSTVSVWRHPLRGAYQFHTYAKDEVLDFRLKIVDLNQNKDADPVELKLWQGGKLLKAVSLADDGQRGDTGQASPARDLRLDFNRIEEGAYRLELVANDDVVTEQIATPQSKLAFINKVWLADGAKTPLSLETDSRVVNVQTINPAKLGTVTVGNRPLEVKETYRQYSLAASDRLTELTLPQDDMIVSGDGVFAADGLSFINPGFASVGPEFDPEQQGIGYVIAGYEPPQAGSDGWQTAEAEFDLGRSAYREFYKYSFMISAPGLKAEDEPQRKLILKEIRIEFSGSSLWDKIKKRLHGK